MSAIRELNVDDQLLTNSLLSDLIFVVELFKVN